MPPGVGCLMDCGSRCTKTIIESIYLLSTDPSNFVNSRSAVVLSDVRGNPHYDMTEENVVGK